MARRAHDVGLKQEVATRLQGVIDEGFGSLYAFREELKKRRLGAHEGTVRGWLPPQERWKAKPDGKAVRRADWEAIALPDIEVLVKLCRTFGWSADYLLLGEGAPYLAQSRDRKSLEEDLAVAVGREVRNQYPDEPFRPVAEGLLPRLVDAVLADAKVLLERVAERRLGQANFELTSRVMRLFEERYGHGVKFTTFAPKDRVLARAWSEVLSNRKAAEFTHPSTDTLVWQNYPEWEIDPPAERTPKRAAGLPASPGRRATRK
jgi:hypothetical protein